jgi:parallel beta-helix repeat protein
MSRRISPIIGAALLAVSSASAAPIKLQPDAFPVTITQSGPYRLAADVAVTNPGRHGITVLANDVAIDLRGHSLKGPGRGSGSAIFQPAGVERLSVSNGGISGWLPGPESGADDGFAILAHGRRNSFASLFVSSNGVGAFLSSQSSISNCNFESHDLGVVALTNNLVFFTTAFLVRSNAFFLGDGSIAAYCTAYDAAVGYVLAGKDAASDYSTAYDCDGPGFFVAGPARLRYCAAYSNDVGIEAGVGVEMLDCALNDNRREGIRATSNCIIRGAASVLNHGDGIAVDDACEVTDSGCNKNRGAGIRALGTANLLEHNKAFENGGAGIEVLSSGNTVVANQAGGNGTANYSVSGSNTLGSIIPFDAAATNRDEDANLGF